MELLDTSSPQCKIVNDKNKKYVIRYPREIGIIREYYRFTPEFDILHELEKTIINVPKTIKNSNYLIQEFVDGSLLSDIFKDHKPIDKDIISQIVNQICYLTTIKYDTLLKYINWNNNESFYTFQCHNTSKVFLNYHQDLKEIYDKLGLSLNIINTLLSYSKNINNDRNLSLIHGDRHKKNIILKDNGKIVFIDWELGGVGDLAYDIAFHLHQMAYTEEDEIFFLNQLKEQYNGNFISLLSDMEIYRLFILARSCIYHVYWTNLVYKEGNEIDKKKQLGHFIRRYNKLSKFLEFNIIPKTEEEIEEIFKSFNKNI